MGLFEKIAGPSSNDREQKQSDHPGKLRLDDFWVAGTYYHKAAIDKISVKNPDWQKTRAQLRKPEDESFVVYRCKYKSSPVGLVLEPSNKNDKNAVKVFICGQHVGYVPRERAKEIHDILSTCTIEAVEARVDGGDCRIFYSDGKEQSQSGNVKIHILLAYRES